MIRWASASLIMVLVASAFSTVQNQTPTIDPQAISFATQSISALTGGSTISDVTLAGNVTWVSGSDTKTGTATVYAKGIYESRIDFALIGGVRSEIRNSTGGLPQGAWIDANGTSTSYAMHNCWTDASWFFPALSSLGAASSDSTVVLSYVGQEVRNGATVQHIQSYHYIPSTKADVTTLTQQVSTIDYYLDAASLLPVAALFNTHPDSDANTNMAVEIDFSNYQAISGYQVPLHVQKFVQGTLVADFSIGSAIFNSGLPDSLFATP